MDFLAALPWGAIMTTIVTLAVGAFGIWTAYVVFRTRTNLIVDQLGKKLDEIVQSNASRHADAERKFDQAIADTNRRVSDLALGVHAADKRHDEFREHVARHFVEKDEIASLRNAIDQSIERMQTSLEAAVGTMGDVRDSVIALTAKAGKSVVPPQRRPSRSTKVGS
jgi:hypothetical protein